MFSKFTPVNVPLSDILLDPRNPRIVTSHPLKTQEEIVEYLFEYEGLLEFIKKIANEGKNFAAEKPYLVRDGERYTVIEGNTRIATYKILCGIQKVSGRFKSHIPTITPQLKESLMVVECAVAPSRDALLPLMASAHFGNGDKSKWGYLGSRKAVYDEWNINKKSTSQLAKAFDKTKGEIISLILEYKLYMEAMKLDWSEPEKKKLLHPAVEFNPPVRFLQTRGHKEKLGIIFDRAGLSISFSSKEAKKRFKHLILKLVVSPQQGLGATARYDAVFQDYPGDKFEGKPTEKGDAGAKGGGTKHDDLSDSASGENQKKNQTALFTYSAKVNSALLRQLMKESSTLNSKNHPASGTFLLRNIVEAILRHLIDEHKANKSGKQIDLEASINLCVSNLVPLSAEDKKILRAFQKDHMQYLNMGAHGNVVPNYERLCAARDCIDQFVKRNA